MMARRVLLGIAVAAAVVTPAAEAANLKLEVLSNRADLLSGGDALVAVKLPEGAAAPKVRVRVNKRDVTKRFKVRANGRYMGLVKGIRNGRSVLRATHPKARGARMRIVNHPNGGPIFSGPQLQPWSCQAGAVDAQCNQPAVYEFRAYNGSTFSRVEDPSSPPASTPTVTTDTGARVPFVVRVEIGYQDRDEYRIATLYDPAQPWKPWAPQAQSNRKLVITHGGSCGTDRKAGESPDVLRAEILRRGFMVMSTALNNLGHNCNPVLITESEVMAKERVVEQYGPIRYTIGTGCSGGSIAQMNGMIAYPGVYQGITVQCTFADLLTTGKHAAAGHLLQELFLKRPLGDGALLTPLEYALVSGSPTSVADDRAFDTAFWPNITGENGCSGMDPALKWTPANRDGVRCGVIDHNVNNLGRGPNGYAAVPFDSVGVQFGLKSLLNGTLSPAAFTDVNARIGGLDKETYGPIPGRTSADVVGVRNAYRSGLITTGNTMDRTPILEVRGPNEATAHVTYPSLSIRARLDEQFGNHDNHVLWQGPVPLLGQADFADRAVFAMDRWIAAIKADKSKRGLPERIRANQPADVTDHCEALPGQELPGTDCPAINRFYESPSNVAGESIRNDILKCQLKPLRRSDYGRVTFSDAQWARLVATFPTGVCDFDKPGVEQTDTIPWLTYAKREGGRRMGPAPRSTKLKPRRSAPRSR